VHTACGFAYDPPDPSGTEADELSLRSIDELRNVVARAIGKSGEVELLYGWEGSERREPEFRLPMHLQQSARREAL
jgi:hypothetical protein